MTTTYEQAGNVLGVAADADGNYGARAVGDAAKVKLGFKADENVDAKQATNAYRKLAKLQHPKKGGSRQAFGELTAAYLVLTGKVSDQPAALPFEGADKYGVASSTLPSDIVSVYLAWQKQLNETAKPAAPEPAAAQAADANAPAVAPVAAAEYVGFTAAKLGKGTTSVVRASGTVADANEVTKLALLLQDAQQVYFTHLPSTEAMRGPLFAALTENRNHNNRYVGVKCPEKFQPTNDEKEQLNHINPDNFRKAWNGVKAGGSWTLETAKAAPANTWYAIRVAPSASWRFTKNNKLALAMMLAAGIVAALSGAGLLLTPVAALVAGGSTKAVVDRRHKLMTGEDAPRNPRNDFAKDAGYAAGLTNTNWALSCLAVLKNGDRGPRTFAPLVAARTASLCGQQAQAFYKGEQEGIEEAARRSSRARVGF